MTFIIVCEQFPNAFQKRVQRYLDEGYKLKGDVFTTNSSPFPNIESYYNQILVKEDEKKET